MIINYANIDILMSINYLLYIIYMYMQFFFFFLKKIETKNHWARDDPAFVVVLATCILGKN